MQFLPRFLFSNKKSWGHVPGTIDFACLYAVEPIREPRTAGSAPVKTLAFLESMRCL